MPAAARTTTRGIFTYVNGRFVRDRVIQHALLDAYRQRLMKGQYPVAVVFIDIPPWVAIAATMISPDFMPA